MIGNSAQMNTGSESLLTRARTTVQDPDIQELKGLFASDFDFSVPGSMKLGNLISKLRKWIIILDSKMKTLPK